MNWLRNAVTAGLLAFVAVSLATAVADVTGLRRTAASPDAMEDGASGDRLIAYYFHTQTRCPTSRAIESHSREAVAQQVAARAMDWRVANYEEPAYRHFAAQFKLPCPSVVLVQTRSREVVRWKNLERVWELNGDRAASVDYVRAQLNAFEEDRP